MSKHTPGPWKVERADSDGANVVAIAQVAWCGANGRFGKDVSQFISSPEAKANARLIAAAPDLLEALNNLVRETQHLSLGESHLKAFERACAAIAKAEGSK